MTGNVIINKVTPPPANAIKKGYTYMGVTGTFEGWVPTPQDLYYNGVNSAGFTGTFWYFQNNRIAYHYSYGTTDCGYITFTKDIDVRSYGKLILEGRINKYGGADRETKVAMSKSKLTASINVDIVGIFATFNITHLSTIVNGDFIYFQNLRGSDKNNPTSYITRIRLA